MSGRVRAVCQHCRKSPAGRPRGLCWGCYRDPDIRNRYPRRFVPQSVPDRFCNPPLPPYPTRAPAGSREKLAVLCIRAMLGYSLWHPDDGPLGDVAEQA